jgi:hypothetical protein
MQGRLVVKKISQDGSDAIRIADGPNRSIAADQAPDGTLHYQATAPAPQGEETSLRACQALVQKLNENGADWAPPTRPAGPEQGVNGEARRSSGEMLRIQVTRPAPSHLWRQLSTMGGATNTLHLYEASDSHMSPIMGKATKTPPKDRPSITLALDVSDTPYLATDGVVADCCQRHGDLPPIMWARRNVRVRQITTAVQASPA